MSARYLAVGHDTNAPFFAFYERSGTTLTKLANPTGGNPAGAVLDVAWTRDAAYLILANTNPSQLTFYKRSGDTLAKLTDVFPDVACNAVEWSSDTTYLAVGAAAVEPLLFYKRSGDTLTKLAVGTFFTGDGRGVAWSDDGTYLAVAHSAGTFVTVYKRSGDTLAKLTAPVTLPTGSARGLAWSADGVYLAVAHDISPFVTIYQRSGDTFTKLANPALLPADNGQDVSWSGDGVYLAVGSRSTSPFLALYKRAGDVLTKLANPAAMPAGTVNRTAFTPNGEFLATSHANGDRLLVHQRSGDTFTKLANPATLPNGATSGVSWGLFNAAPNAPTLVSPIGGATIDRAIIQRLSWTFSDPDAGDSQSKYDLRYRIVGGPTWTDTTGTTTSTFWDAPASTFVAADYEWQVRTYDAQGLVGPYSGSEFFTARAAPPEPTITAPISGGTVSAETFNVAWSTPDQDAYQVRTVADNAGAANPAVIYTDTGVVESASARSRPVAFPANNRNEHIQVRIRDGGLWSLWASIRILVSFTPPATPTVLLSASNTTGAISALLESPAPGGGQPSVTGYDLHRRETLVGGDGIRIKAGVAAGEVVDFTPASGVQYQYRARALGDNGTSAYSAWTS